MTFLFCRTAETARSGIIRNFCQLFRGGSGRALQMFGEASKQTTSIGTSHDVLNMVLGMGHHAEHVALLTDDAGNRCGRAIDVVRVADFTIRRTVAIEDAPITFEATNGLF